MTASARLRLFVFPFLLLTYFFFFSLQWPSCGRRSSGASRVPPDELALLPGRRRHVSSVEETPKEELSLALNGRASSIVDWRNAFAMVPIGQRACFELYRGRPLAFDYEIRQAIEAHKWKLEEVLRELNMTLSDVEGNTGNYGEQYMFWYELGRRLSPYVRTVCQTGFNAGHDALLWLASNAQAQIFSFDLGAHTYSKRMARFLNGKFGQRLLVTWGDSLYTLPHFRRTHPDVRCDLVIIDGGHTYQVTASDWAQFREMTHDQSVLLIDNYPDPRFPEHDIGLVWETAKRDSEISEIFRCSFLPKADSGFAVARRTFLRKPHDHQRNRDG